jgi:hypothetical protein
LLETWCFHANRNSASNKKVSRCQPVGDLTPESNIGDSNPLIGRQMPFSMDSLRAAVLVNRCYDPNTISERAQ